MCKLLLEKDREIIQTLPQNDGSTLIQVLEWPLGWTERPRRTVSFQGEFLVLLKEPVAPSLYRGKEKITVAGEILGSIQGEKIKSVPLEEVVRNKKFVPVDHPLIAAARLVGTRFGD